MVSKRTPKVIFDLFWGNRILHEATRLIAVSKAERTQYENCGIPTTKISVVYNGIDSSAYRKLPRAGGFVKDKLGTDTKVVTYIGRLNARKGLDTLLRAFASVNRSDPKTFLVLVGPDDGYRRPLEQLAEQLRITSSTIFTGMITMPHKLQVLADSDVVVYPGYSEIFGLVPFEALACGRPVVVCDDSGCGEIIREQGAGITFPPGDASTLQRGIEMSLQRGAEIEAAVLRGLRFVERELDWNRIAAATEAIYQEAFAAAG